MRISRKVEEQLQQTAEMEHSSCKSEKSLLDRGQCTSASHVHPVDEIVRVVLFWQLLVLALRAQSLKDSKVHLESSAENFITAL